MKFFKQQKVTCLSHVPEDMSTMQKLVASMIHHAADLFKVCTCAIEGKAHITELPQHSVFLVHCCILFVGRTVSDFKPLIDTFQGCNAYKERSKLLEARITVAVVNLEVGEGGCSVLGNLGGGPQGVSHFSLSRFSLRCEMLSNINQNLIFGIKCSEK